MVGACRNINFVFHHTYNAAVQIGLENPSYTVAEDAGSVRVCATESGPVQLDRDVVVTFTTADDTASGRSAVLRVHACSCCQGNCM